MAALQEDEAAEAEFQKKLAKLNAEWDAKIAELERQDQEETAVYLTCVCSCVLCFG
jgi:hypothetical protein